MGLFWILVIWSIEGNGRFVFIFMCCKEDMMFRVLELFLLEGFEKLLRFFCLIWKNMKENCWEISFNKIDGDLILKFSISCCKI